MFRSRDANGIIGYHDTAKMFGARHHRWTNVGLLARLLSISRIFGRTTLSLFVTGFSR